MKTYEIVEGKPVVKLVQNNFTKFYLVEKISDWIELLKKIALVSPSSMNDANWNVKLTTWNSSKNRHES